MNQPAEWYRQKREQRGVHPPGEHIWGRLIAKHQNMRNFRWKRRPVRFYPGKFGDTHDRGPGSFVWRIAPERLLSYQRLIQRIRRRRAERA